MWKLMLYNFPLFFPPSISFYTTHYLNLLNSSSLSLIIATYMHTHTKKHKHTLPLSREFNQLSPYNIICVCMISEQSI